MWSSMSFAYYELRNFFGNYFGSIENSHIFLLILSIILLIEFKILS